MTIPSPRLASAFILAVALVTAMASFPLLGDSDREAQSAAIALLDDWGGGDSHQDRAAMPEIFIGHVIERDGEANIAESDSASFIVPVYLIDVESTLKGNAEGRIRLGVVTTMFANDRSGGPFVVGQRYLFAAFGPAGDDVYTIDEGFGNFPIANDAEKMELIFRFEKWIAKAERRERREPSSETDLCDQPALHPKFDLQPSQGPPGAVVLLTATGLEQPEVAIWWGDFAVRLEEAEVDERCTITARIIIPPDASPGLYQVHIVGARQVQSQGMFRVLGH